MEGTSRGAGGVGGSNARFGGGGGELRACYLSIMWLYYTCYRIKAIESGLLDTPVCYSLKLGGPLPPVEPSLL